VAAKVGITSDQVVDVASSVADREGATAVSLSSVAAALGVRSPSLYAHVDGLGGLRRPLDLRASGPTCCSATGSPTRSWVSLSQRRACARRDTPTAFAREHPGLYAALLPVPRLDEDAEGAAVAARTLTVTARVLSELGIDPSQLVDLIRALRAMLHG